MDFYGGKDPRDVPAYTLPMAAGMLHMPASTLRTWVKGYRTSTGKDMQRVIRAASEGRVIALSFTNLVEAFVLSALRKDHQIDLPQVRRALKYLESELGSRSPLATETFGVRPELRKLFVERFGTLTHIGKEGVELLEHDLGARVGRIVYVDGKAQRLFPIVRKGATAFDAPRVVVIDPERAFGRPVVDGSGVPVDVLRGRFDAGDAIESLVSEFRIDREKVEEALRRAA